MERIKGIKRPLFLSALLLSVSLIVFYFWGFNYFLISVALSFFTALTAVRRYAAVIILSFCFIAAVFNVKIADSRENTTVKYSGDDYTFNLVAVSDEEETKVCNVITVKLLDGKPFLKNTQFNLFYRENHFNCGDVFVADVSFFEQSKPNKSNFAQNIYGSLWLKGVNSKIGTDVVYSLFGNVRSYINDFLSDNLSKNSAATLTAVILGDKSALKSDFDLCVKRAGVSHIMAVSGLHLSVILGFLFLIFGQLIKNKYANFLISIFSVFAFTGVCGFKPSVLRAGLMFVIFAFAVLIERDADILNTIGAAVTFILIISPGLLFSISFQMSVLAIISVIYVTPFYARLIFNKAKIRSNFLKLPITAILVSLMAGLFTMPVAIYNFGYISMVSVLTNLLISFATTLVIQLALIGLILSLFSVDLNFIMLFTDYVTRYINFVIEYFGSLKYSAIVTNKQLFVIPIALIFIILILMCLIKRREVIGDGS